LKEEVSRMYTKEKRDRKVRRGGEVTKAEENKYHPFGGGKPPSTPDI